MKMNDYKYCKQYVNRNYLMFMFWEKVSFHDLCHALVWLRRVRKIFVEYRAYFIYYNQKQNTVLCDTTIFITTGLFSSMPSRCCHLTQWQQGEPEFSQLHFVTKFEQQSSWFEFVVCIVVQCIIMISARSLSCCENIRLLLLVQLLFMLQKVISFYENENSSA